MNNYSVRTPRSYQRLHGDSFCVLGFSFELPWLREWTPTCDDACLRFIVQVHFVVLICVPVFVQVPLSDVSF